MRKLYYILILLVIFTNYLFSQSEGNELIKVDTTIDKKPVADTVIIEKPVSVEKEKTDFVKYDFYNDYLPSIKTDTSEFTPETEKIGILSVRAGIGIFLLGGSVALDLPVQDKLNISSYFYVDKDEGTIFGLGLGYVPIKTNNFILKFNMRPSIAQKGSGFGLNIGTDFIYKSISISPDIFVIDDANIVPLIMLSFGYNYKFKGTYRN